MIYDNLRHFGAGSTLDNALFIVLEILKNSSNGFKLSISSVMGINAASFCKFFALTAIPQTEQFGQKVTSF
uniref:Uncharacterized protein n=1 Tax=Romanomermis culicivorax TaxID=13658 RepID=A0A915J0E6_ROMCU